MIVNDIKLKVESGAVSVTVTASPQEIATEQVRIAERQRVLGIISNFMVVYDRNPAPLTAKLKFQLAFRVAHRAAQEGEGDRKPPRGASAFTRATGARSIPTRDGRGLSRSRQRGTENEFKMVRVFPTLSSDNARLGYGVEWSYRIGPSQPGPARAVTISEVVNPTRRT